MEEIFEVCCGSYQDALNAYVGGAKRIELNSALYLGGLTPSVSSLRLIKKNTDLKVICMVRPRPAGFYYNQVEFKQMLCEAEELLISGADGIAFGCLNLDYSINLNQLIKMGELIRKYRKESVFHRAFDCTIDTTTAIEQLIKYKITRVLTSGQQENAVDGKQLIKKLQSNYGTKIEILAGSGIKVENVQELIAFTGVKQLHASCKAFKTDPTTSGLQVSYGYHEGVHKNDFEEVNSDIVEQLVTLVRKTI